METRTLAAIVLTLAVVPALASFGCNRKEDLAPAPSATQPPVAPPPVAAPPPAAPIVTPQPIAGKAAPRGDAGVHDAAALALKLPDGAPVSFALPDGAVVVIPALPPIPTLHPSALPAIASGIVGGIIGALPPGLVPAPAPSK